MLSATVGEVPPDERRILAGATSQTCSPAGCSARSDWASHWCPATIVAVQGVPRALSGLASGVLNTSRFVGAALGLAVLSTLAANHTSSEINSGTSAAKALTEGFQLQFEVGALFCLVGVVAAVVLLRPQRAEAAEVGATMAEAERA